MPSMTSKKFNRKKLAVATMLLTLSMAGAVTPVIAQSNSANTETAAIQATQHQYNISSQTLGDALIQFGRQSNLEVIADAPLVSDKQTAGVQGTMTMEQGIVMLLENTGLTYQLDGSLITLAAVTQGSRSSNSSSGIRELAPATVGANSSALTEGSGSYTTNSMSTATKFDMTLRQTPQSVSIVSRQLIDDFALQDMNDILNITPGVIVGTLDVDRSHYTARSYQMLVQYDGMPSVGFDGGATSGPDSAILDRTEVLLGASGLLNGSGDIGGTINMVLKKPTAEFQASIGASVGSWNERRLSGDISGSLNDAGSVRGRLVMVGQDNESFRDYIGRKKSVTYGVIEGDLSNSTTVWARAYIQDLYDSTTDRKGLPTGENGKDLQWGRSTLLVPDWSSWDKYSTSYTVGLEQQLAGDWTLKAKASQHKAEADWLFSNWSGFDESTGNATFSPWWDTSVETTKDAEVYTAGSVELFGRQHELMLGANWVERKATRASGEGDPVVDVNLYTFDPSSTLAQPTIDSTSPRVRKYEQYGMFAAGRFNVTDAMTAIIGSRVSWYEDDSTTEESVLTPYVGLVYDLNDWASAYASYSDIFIPQTNRSPDGSTLDPEVGSNYELGVKGEFFNGRLNASLAVFKVEKTNEAVHIASIPYSPTNACGGDCYNASGKTVTDGFDINVSGEISDRWSVMGGYSQYKKDGYDDTSHSLKLSSSYNLNEQWSFGGSVDANSRSYGLWGLREDSRTLLGLFGRYQISNNISVALNANNLLDEVYYANDGSISWSPGQFYGQPRSWSLSFNSRW